MTNHLALAVSTNERSKALLDQAAGDGAPIEVVRTLTIMAGVAAAQAQVHATLFLAERTHA